MRKATTVLTAAMVMMWVMGTRPAAGQRDGRPVVSEPDRPVMFRLASSRAVRGFEKVSDSAGRGVYLAPGAALRSDEVVSADTIEGRDGTAVALSLSEGAADRLGSMLRKHGVDQLAVFVNGQLVANGSVSVEEGRATVSGLTSIDAERIVRAARGDLVPLGTVVSLVPSQTKVAPGEVFAVDVLVSGATDLRAYEMKLLTMGGTSGQMTVLDPVIDTARSDYVFQGISGKFEIEDSEGQRLAGVIIQDGIDATNPSYLGTFLVQASPEASGTFVLTVNVKGGMSSLLFTDARPMSFSIMQANITVADAR